MCDDEFLKDYSHYIWSRSTYYGNPYCHNRRARHMIISMIPGLGQGLGCIMDRDWVSWILVLS